MSIPASAIGPAVNGVLETMYFLVPAYKGPGRLECPAFAATLGFTGALQGIFRVVVNRDLAARMTAEFLATEPGQVSEKQAEATVCELANIACGAVLSEWMPEADFRFGIPSALKPAGPSEAFQHCFDTGGNGVDIGFDVAID